MNFKETHQLLIFIAQYDNRRIDDGVVIAWQAVVADLDFDVARQAVVNHFGTSEAYLMPVHVRRGVDDVYRDQRRRAREARELEAAKQAAIEAADPTRRDRSEAIEQLIAEMRAKLPEGNPDALRYASGYWRQVREDRERQERAEPNPHYDPSIAARLAAEAEEEGR